MQPAKTSVAAHRPVVCSRCSGYRAPCTVIFEAALSISRRSSGVSSTAAAPMFSSRRSSLRVPGIGTIHGIWASSQAKSQQRPAHPRQDRASDRGGERRELPHLPAARPVRPHRRTQLRARDRHLRQLHHDRLRLRERVGLDTVRPAALCPDQRPRLPQQPRYFQFNGTSLPEQRGSLGTSQSIAGSPMGAPGGAASVAGCSTVPAARSRNLLMSRASSV